MSRIRETKIVTKTEEVTVGYKCDNCDKVHSGKSQPDEWHEFSGHHESWGNDSFESYEYYMACSPECYVNLLKKAVKEFEDYNTSEIDGFSIDFAKNMVGFLKKT